MKTKFKKGKRIGTFLNTKSNEDNQSLEINFTLTDKDFEKALLTSVKNGRYIRLKLRKK